MQSQGSAGFDDFTWGLFYCIRSKLLFVSYYVNLKTGEFKVFTALKLCYNKQINMKKETKSMHKQLLMGNEAIALGAIHAGVGLVSGYPGTPSTEILETVAKHNKDGKIHVQWSVNEKVALEVAAGGAYAGASSMRTMLVW